MKPETFLKILHDWKHCDLMPREVQIMFMRWGSEDGSTHTLEEVGKKFGVTRERIRQIEARALERLRTRINESENV